MEGALESGLVAVARIAGSAGLNLAPEYGKFKGV
jgi:hypothetical protein